MPKMKNETLSELAYGGGGGHTLSNRESYGLKRRIVVVGNNAITGGGDALSRFYPAGPPGLEKPELNETVLLWPT